MYSKKPYLIRAILAWIVDNDKTPYVLVDATVDGLAVPEQYIKDGKIILNISASATANLFISNQSLSFNASFGQVPYEIYIPLQAIEALYAHENGQGMAFDNDDGELPPDDHPPSDSDTSSSSNSTSSSDKKPPFLKVVK